jgi:hypothetical protein
MTGSSPADLVVTFRSIPRRLRESQGDAPTTATGSTAAELQRKVGEAAGLLHCAATPAAVADTIAAIKTREWDDATLDSLREIALEIGALLRRIEADAAAFRK